MPRHDDKPTPAALTRGVEEAMAAVRKERENPRQPMPKIRASGTCEACGECRECIQASRDRAEVVRLRRLLKRARGHIERLVADVENETDAARGLPGEDIHPAHTRARRNASHARNFLKKFD